VNADIVQEAHGAFVRLIFEASAIACAAGECEGYALGGLREAGCAIEGDAARLDSRRARLRQSRSPFDEVGVLGAHHVDPHVTAAGDVAGFLIVLAAMRAEHVVTVAVLAKNRDQHFFEQTGILPFELGGFRGLHLEDRSILLDLLEIDSIRLAGNILWRGRRGFFAFDVPCVAALQINGRGDACKDQSDRRRPARVSRRFTSAHDSV
jgi:hypothetical protein